MAVRPWAPETRAPWGEAGRDVAVATLPFSTAALLSGEAAADVLLPQAIWAAAPKRRADYIAGRLCAQAAVAQLTGQSLPVGRADHGAPLWPGGVSGSISHSDGLAIAIAAWTRHHRALGVDVERMMGAEQAETLLPLILTRAERARFAGHALTDLATLAFSMKESLFKALHPLTGTMFFHEDAELIAIDPAGTAKMRLLVPLSPAWPRHSLLTGHWTRQGDHLLTMVVD